MSAKANCHCFASSVFWASTMPVIVVVSTPLASGEIQIRAATTQMNKTEVATRKLLLLILLVRTLLNMFLLAQASSTSKPTWLQEWRHLEGRI